MGSPRRVIRGSHPVALGLEDLPNGAGRRLVVVVVVVVFCASGGRCFWGPEASCSQLWPSRGRTCICPKGRIEKNVLVVDRAAVSSGQLGNSVWML
jgi:hypothetical protein